MMDTFINSFDEERLQGLCQPLIIPHSAGVTLRWPGADLLLSGFSPQQINKLAHELEAVTGRLTEKAYRMGWDAAEEFREWALEQEKERAREAEEQQKPPTYPPIGEEPFNPPAEDLENASKEPSGDSTTKGTTRWTRSIDS
jgi:hypothetical protein